MKLDLQSDEHKSAIHRERRFSDHRATNIHERMQDLTKSRRRPFQYNDKSRTLQMVIRKIQKCDDTFSETDTLSALGVDIERSGFSRKFKDHPIESRAHVWRRDRDTLRIRKSSKAAWEKRHEKVQCIILVLPRDRRRYTSEAIVAAIIWSQRRCRKMGDTPRWDSERAN